MYPVPDSLLLRSLVLPGVKLGISGALARVDILSFVSIHNVRRRRGDKFKFSVENSRE
jgi:hypothetical protein